MMMEFFGNTEFMLSIVGAVYVSLIIFMYPRIIKRRSNRNKKFYSTLENGFKNATIKAVNDIILIYDGIFVSENDSRERLVVLLKKYLIDFFYGQNLAEDIKNAKKEFKKEVDIYHNISNKFETLFVAQELIEKTIIECNSKSTGYSEMPMFEQNLILDIKAFLSQDDKENVVRKIDELSNTILLRSEELDKISRINKWTLPISIISTSITVIGIIITIIK